MGRGMPVRHPLVTSYRGRGAPTPQPPANRPRSGRSSVVSWTAQAHASASRTLRSRSGTRSCWATSRSRTIVSSPVSPDGAHRRALPTRWCVARGGGAARCGERRCGPGGAARHAASPVRAVPDRRPGRLCDEEDSTGSAAFGCITGPSVAGKMEIPAWCLLIVWVIAGVGGTYLTCPGCVNRTWQNIACVLTGDDVRPLDVRNAEHRQHPIEDAQLAKELAVRYAAAEHPQPSALAVFNMSVSSKHYPLARRSQSACASGLRRSLARGDRRRSR